MPFISSPGFGIGGKTPPTPFYPVNSVVPYYGLLPEGVPVGWQRWSGADGRILLGSYGDGNTGTTYQYYPATIQSTGGYSAGAHTYQSGTVFTTIYHATQTGTAGPATSYLNGGNHTHSGGTFSWNGQITPDTITVNFLRSTQITYELPANSIVSRNNMPSNSAPVISDGRRRYITGSDTVASGTSTIGSRTQYTEWATGTSGSHYHSPSNNRARGLAGYGYNYDTAYAGSHFHTSSRTVTQSIFGTTTVLKAWQILSILVPKSEMIIMYLGSLSSLKPPWYVCDGTRGTIDLRNKFVAMVDNASASHGQDLAADDDYGTEIIGTSNSNAYHSHQGSYLNYRGTTPASASHLGQYWFHSHSYSTQISGGAFPPRIALHFIQYKGQ